MLATGNSAAADSGTTLMEMLVVIAISVLISGIAFPRLERMITAIEFRQSSTLLAAHLRMAQARALLQHKPVVVDIAADGQSYAWTGGASQKLAADMKVQSRTAEPLIFFPDGSARAAVWTLSNKRRSRSFTIAEATGVVVIK
jgi:general secretion pathway protein H